MDVTKVIFPVTEVTKIVYSVGYMNGGTLLTFVGNRDPYADEAAGEPGPILSLLAEKPFCRVFLFCTGPAYFERAKTVETLAAVVRPEARFNFISLDLLSVVDYEEIYRKLGEALDGIGPHLPTDRKDIFVLLDPGTPQMQTSWFLLVKSGVFPASLLQGVPPRFAGGAYKVKTVDLDSAVLPRVSPPEGRSSKGLGTPDLDVPVGGWFVRPSEAAIIGEAPAFRRAMEQAVKLAAYAGVSVLIRGETGSGKGLIARLIHDRSLRREKPFLPLNCSAISSTLAESEFFGHRKGAFTGAESERIGQFRAADGGTVFLDEIGDLPLDIQPKLLRVLEDRTIIPVGSDKEIKVDVRIIAATNRDLEDLIEKKLFRRDLYERLNNVTLTLPPLRDRKEDIPLLVHRFQEDWNRTYGENKKLAPETFARFYGYPWPGNVRELQNVVTALCASGRGPLIGPELLPPSLLAGGTAEPLRMANHELPAGGMNLKAFLFQIEKDYYTEALTRAGGNKERAAELLGLNGPAFRKALRERFGIEEEA